MPSTTKTAADAISIILNKWRLSKGWNAESPEDHNLRVVAWLEVLGVARIPVEEYDGLYRRSLRTRQQRAERGETLFNLAPDDLVAEWHKLQAARKDALDRERLADLPANCPNRHEHRTPEEAVRDYGFPGEAEEWLPCHVCRPQAFQRRKADRSAERAEKTRQTVRGLLGLGKVLPFPSSEIDREIDAICARIRRDPADPEAQQEYRDALERKAQEMEKEEDV